jgi:hypothetical protein
MREKHERTVKVAGDSNCTNGKGKGMVLSKEEWNFDEVPDNELVACCDWEYARELANGWRADQVAGKCRGIC